MEVPVFVDEDVTTKTSYHLRAMIIHSGTLNSGHYTAMIKDSNTGAWMDFNDRAVKFCSKDQLSNEGSYVLFYQRT